MTPLDVLLLSYIKGCFVYCPFLLVQFMSYIKGCFVYCPFLLVQFNGFRGFYFLVLLFPFEEI